MHKRKGSFKSRAIQEYRNNLKKIKQRKVSSIWDIIDDPELHFFQKIDYIRHHFVYYDGNYELFHDENGKPTETKKLLDEVIKGIINKEIDPSELNALNKEILKDHKTRMEQKKLIEEQRLNEYLQEQPKSVGVKPVIPVKKEEKYIPELATYKQGINDCAKPYFEIIDKYLLSLSPEERAKALTWSYKDLKKVAKWWDKNNKPVLPPTAPSEMQQQKKSIEALLKGYRRYAAKEWKNSES